VTGKWDRIRQAETAEVRLDQGSTAGSSASARLTARFGPPVVHAVRDLSLPKTRNGVTLASQPPESGECRIPSHQKLSPTPPASLSPITPEPEKSHVVLASAVSCYQVGVRYYEHTRIHRGSLTSFDNEHLSCHGEYCLETERGSDARALLL
jgi:hypothetical protein